MKKLIKVALLTAVACQAEAQSGVIKVPAKHTSAIVEEYHDYLDQKELPMQLDFKTFDENESKKSGSLKTKILDLKDTGTQKSSGGHDGNGGDIVVDPKSQKRTLLDLVEQDDLVPVELSGRLYDQELYVNFYLYYFTLDQHREYDSIYRSGFGSPAFTYFLLSATGLDLENCTRATKKELGESYRLYELAHPSGRECGFSVMEDLFKFIRETSLKPKALKWHFTTSDLKDIQDEGLIRVADPDSKRQVAVQKDGIVVINEAEFKKLDARNKTALIIHEIMIYVTVNLNPDLIPNFGSAPVRTFVRRVIRQTEGRLGRTEKVNDDWVMESFNALGIK